MKPIYQCNSEWRFNLQNERTETAEVNIYIKNSRPSCGVENGAGKIMAEIELNEIPDIFLLKYANAKRLLDLSRGVFCHPIK